MPQTDGLGASVALIDSLENQVTAFADRRRAHRSAKGSARGHFAPTKAERDQRRKVMDRIEVALGLSVKSIASILEIDPSTWGKWKSHGASPRPLHIQRLRGIAAGEIRVAGSQGLAGHSTTADDEPEALTLLSRNRTHARLRLFFNAIKWDNAVLCFSKPWRHYHTVLDMAILALRGCHVIYLLHFESPVVDSAVLTPTNESANPRSGTDEPQSTPADSKTEAWGFAMEFARKLRQMLGDSDAARALSRIAFINFDPGKLTEKEFAAWNYPGDDNPDTNAVAYNYEPVRNDEAERQDLDLEGEWLQGKAVFYAIPKDGEIFTELRSHHDQLISSARQAIRRRGEDFRPFWKGSPGEIQLIWNETGGDRLEDFAFQKYPLEEI